MTTAQTTSLCGRLEALDWDDLLATQSGAGLHWVLSCRVLKDGGELRKAQVADFAAPQALHPVTQS